MRDPGSGWCVYQVRAQNHHVLVGRHEPWFVIAAHTKQGSMAMAACIPQMPSRQKDRINMSTFNSRINKRLPLWSIPLLSLLWSAPAHAR